MKHIVEWFHKAETAFDPILIPSYLKLTKNSKS